MAVMLKDRWLATFGRTMYALVCIGVVLLAVAYVHYAYPEAPTGDARERSRRRLASLQASPLR